MLLQVKKIKKNELKDRDGAIKKIPGTSNPIVKWVVVSEAIDVNFIKAVRPFDRDNGDHYTDIKGDISVIYFRSTGDASAEMHVVCDYETLVKDVNKLRQGSDKEAVGAG